MWKYCKIYCISIISYIKNEKKVQTEDWKKKNNVAIVATAPLGTVATVQNLFKKKKKEKKNTMWLTKMTL